jgi:lipid-binding SYLF domain-containing protein
MNLNKFWAVALSATVFGASVAPALADQQNAIDSVQSATQVFSAKVTESKNQIPKSVLEKAVAIAIIPNVVKAGFILGGTRGAGVLVVRNNKGEWSNPAFVTLTGGSVGLQVGAQSSDVIMIFNTKKSLEKALAQDFNLGGSVSGSAGPTGATPVTGTSTVPDVWTYVRTREGLFGGVSLQGTKLEIDNSRNAQFYENPDITTKQIFTTSLPAPDAAADLRKILNRYAPR